MSTAPLRLVVEDENGWRGTRELIEELLADDFGRFSALRKACEAGVPEVRDLVSSYLSDLNAAGHQFYDDLDQFHEVFWIILDLCERVFPDQPVGARQRLRQQVRGDVRMRPDGGVKITGQVDVGRAVEIVVAYEDSLFDRLVISATGHASLYDVARRIWSGLSSIGRQYPVELVEDEVWRLVRVIAPHSPAAAPDARRQHDLWMRAQRYVSEHDRGGVLDEEVRQQHEVRSLEALRHHDLSGYRSALRDLCVAARDAARAYDQEDDQGESSAGPAA